MAKGMYIGAGGVAGKVKKVYVGTGGVAHKVKRAYLGVGGVARCIFGGEGVELIGMTEPLQVARRYLAAAQNGLYAAFAGGEDSGGKPVGNVDAFDQTFTKHNVLSLSHSRKQHAAAQAGNYIIFAGGADYSDISLNACESYDISYTKGSPPVLGSAVRMPASTSGWEKERALFAGGKNRSDADVIDSGTCYDKSLTKKTFKPGIYGTEMAAASNSVYSMFAGGTYLANGYTQVNRITAAFDLSLTRAAPPDLSKGAYRLAAAATENYIVFMGGVRDVISDVVEAFDRSLTKHAVPPLSAVRYGLSAETVGDYIVVVGGRGRGDKCSAVIDVYDKSLTRIKTLTLPADVTGMASTGLGSYALFGGGEKQEGSSLLRNDEVYVLKAE